MKKAQQGFSLIELAFVVVIISLLIGGLAVPLSAQIQARRIAETRKIMEEAREALMGYAMTHTVDHDGNPATPNRPFLPCPDANGNDGTESRVGTECLQPRGFFPWRDLGVASQDAWGNRLRYEVPAPFSDSATGFSNTSINMGNIQVCSASGCVAPGDVASNVPVVLVSHGPNGWGGLNVNGNMLAAPISADELENTNADNIYVSHTPTTPGPTEFDDLVVWISAPLLISRVCPTPGGCPP